MSNKEDFCDIVKDIVTKDRTNYDKEGGEDSFQTIADLWNYYLNNKVGIKINLQPHHICMLLIMLKQARLMNNEYHKDSIIDIAGYAANYFDKICNYEEKPNAKEHKIQQ